MSSFTRILCPIDYSEPSRTALTEAIRLARESRAELLLVHVIPSYPPPIFDLTSRVPTTLPTQDERLAEAEDILRDFIQKQVPAEVHCREEVLLGEAALEIPAFATAIECDLIVMATHGRSGWRHLCLGSVTEVVARNATCPVLSIGPNCQLSTAWAPAAQEEESRRAFVG